MFAPFIIICLAVSTFAFPQERAENCNGYSKICDRKYSNVSLVGANNSPIQGSKFMNVEFHWDSVLKQLSSGVQFLSAEIYDNEGEIAVCHKFCTGGSQQAQAPRCEGKLSSFLKDISTFLGVNTREVVTLRLINGDKRALKDIDLGLARSGLRNRAFVSSARPLPIDAWPTYGELIERKKRFILFLDAGADSPNKYSYILPQKDYFFETAKNEFKKCDAVPSDADAQGKMYMLNHNNEFQSRQNRSCREPETNAALLSATNSANAVVGGLSAGIMQHANTCKGKFNKHPTVFWLNSINLPLVNGPLVAQRELNGLPGAILGVST